MRETESKQKFRDMLLPDINTIPVENVRQSGMPDLFYHGRGVAGWIENKVEHSGIVKFEKFQIPFMVTMLRQGFSRTWVAVQMNFGVVAVYHCTTIVTAPRYVDGKWTCIKMGDLNKQAVWVTPDGRQKLVGLLLS